MKIRYFIAAGILMSASLFSSCNNLFDDAPMNKISDEVTWKNSMLLDEYVNTWYRGMSNGFNTYVPSSALLKSISRYYLPWFGDQLSVGKNDWFNAGYGDVLKGNEESITGWARALWSAYYTRIGYINNFFENQGKVKDKVQKDRILGEAYFFRAYYYYMLWQRFGGVLLIDHSYDPLHDPEKFPRASYEDMVKFIVEDLDKALPFLPVKNEPINMGRITKGAALMLKAKTYLWAASESFQNKQEPYLGFSDNKAPEMLRKAEEAYNQLFALNAYSLVAINATTQEGIKNEYRKIFLTKNSEESILEVQHSDDGDYANKFGHKLDRDAAAPFFTGTTAAYTPTQNHVDEYGMQPGKVYDKNNPYENRDYRFYANILYDGAVYKNHVMDMHTTDNKPGVDMTPYGTSTTAAFSRTGYYMAKFLDESQVIDNNETFASKQNYIIWRYAEALLDYAEVEFHLGHQDEALKAVNKIRERVHMDALPSITMEQIRNERRVELAFEETTYWDYFRWHEAVQKLDGESNPLKAMTIKVVGGKKKYKVVNLNRFPARVRVFQEKEYYLPIPWSDVRYQGINQNPGWHEM